MKFPSMLLFIIAGAYTLLFSEPTLATEISEPNVFLPLLPRISTLGLAGTDQLIGGDAMFPVHGNSNHVLFLDVQAKSAFNTAWLGSVGTGIRMVQDNQRILGAYVFADRTISSENQEFLFASPGIESMGKIWDFRANGYIPLSSSRVLTSTGFADEYGNYDYVQFDQHTQLDAVVNNYEQVGWGVDGEIGRRIPWAMSSRAYLGGYHFDISNASDINGISGRLEYPVNSHISVSLRDTYDNQQHNTIEAGLQLTFGGVNRSPGDPNQPIQERLLDPISRNLATLGQGNGEPVVSEQQVIQSTAVAPLVERTNIWFFDPNAAATFNGINSCTSDNPCSSPSFNQTTINGINGFALTPMNPSFYFRQGGYGALNNGVPDFLTNDSLFSRTQDYQAPQRGAIFDGAFNVAGTSTFSAITLLNDSTFVQPYAVNLNAGSQLTFADSVIGPSDNTPATAYATGINMSDSRLNVIQGSEIYTYSNISSSVGINATDSVGSQITVDNSLITSTVLGLTSTSNYEAFGILSQNQPSANATATITVSDGAQVNANATGNFGIFNIAGISASETTNSVRVNSGSSVNGSANITNGNTLNVTGVTLLGANNTLQISGNSSLSATANLTAGSEFIPVNLFASTIQLDGVNNNLSIGSGTQLNATINANNAQQAIAQNIFVNDQGSANTNISITNSQLNVNNTAANVTAVNDPYQVIAEGIFVNTENSSGAVSNVINMSGTTLNIAGTINNANSSGYSNNILAEGIDIGDTPDNGVPTGNVNNTVTVSGSTLNVEAHMLAANNDYPNVLIANGINLVSGGNSNNTVNLSGANLQIDALINTGSFNNYDEITTAGISSLMGDNSVNTIQVKSNSTIDATAEITNAGNFNDFLTAYGLNVASGNSGTTTVTIGTAGDLTDHTLIEGNAITDFSTGFVNNTLNAFGIYVNSISGSNSITVQGSSAVDATSQILNSGSNAGTSTSNAEGIYTSSSGSVSTILADASTITASASATGLSTTVTAIGVESIAPVGFNSFSNYDGSNSNIMALQNGVNDGQLVYQHQ